MANIPPNLNAEVLFFRKMYMKVAEGAARNDCLVKNASRKKGIDIYNSLLFLYCENLLTLLYLKKNRELIDLKV